MPTYEYYCEQCGVFDVFQNMSDPPLTSCPTCSLEVRRLISGGTGVIFKGSGFFNTDRRKEAKTQSKAETSKETPQKEAV